jgi:hypothetical protein
MGLAYPWAVAQRLEVGTLGCRGTQSGISLRLRRAVIADGKVGLAELCLFNLCTNGRQYHDRSPAFASTATLGCKSWKALQREKVSFSDT